MPQTVETKAATAPGQPSNEMMAEQEAQILAICRHLLKNPNLLATDDFFDAGGNSLLAMNLMLELEMRFGLAPGLETIFNAPTVRTLCTALTRAGERKPAAILPIRLGTSKEVLYLTHSTFDIAPLSTALRDDLGVAYVLVNDPSWLRVQMSECGILASIKRISDAYADVIMARGGGAPFFLGGCSFGGVLAVETACRLEERGVGPGMIFLFDTYLHRAAHRILYDIAHNHWLTRKLRQARAQRGKGVEPLAPSVEADPSIVLGRMFSTLRDEASRSYRGPGRRLKCRTVLFRASLSLDGRPLRHNSNLGWARDLGDRLTVVPASGDHFSMLGQAHAREIAMEIDRQIRSHVRLLR